MIGCIVGTESGLPDWYHGLVLERIIECMNILGLRPSVLLKILDQDNLVDLTERSQSDSSIGVRKVGGLNEELGVEPTISVSKVGNKVI